MADHEFDFIVVGAGSAGCVLANRLSAGPHRVLVVEAGPEDTSPWIHLPIGYGKTMWDDRVNWRFKTEPEPNMHGRQIYWPRGRVLGGSSSINGLIAIRGQPADYDGWEEAGCPGWSWPDVFPYFLKLEQNPDLAGTQLHGASGPLAVSSIPKKHELIEAVIRAAEQLGVPRSDDFNGRTQEGVGYYQLTTQNGWRMSAARAYLMPVRSRRNLEVETDAHVSRVVIEDGRAVGVEYQKGDQRRIVRAGGGVVLSAGAVQSPQILMLSGIGPADHLRSHGITPVHELREVGSNLQDHLQVRLIFKCTKPITTNDELRTWAGQIKIALQWLLFRGGPLAIGINQGGLFTRVMPQSVTPDIQFHISTLSADMAGAKPHPFSGFTFSVCQLRPDSRGSITLRDANPLSPPKIQANYLATEHDQACITAGIAFARKLARTSPMTDYVEEEVSPGPAARSEADLLEFARRHGATIFHPTGTCRMGSDAGAVVDPRLRVKGIAGLWVADCSIMPTIVSGNTNLPAIMIGEKAADMILADSRVG